MVTAVPVSSVLGVELRGFNPRTSSTVEMKAFQSAFLKHKLVLLRKQDMSADDCVRLTELLGTAQVRDPTPYDTDKVMHITNAPGGHLPKGEVVFHMDGSYRETPLKAISLFALAVPSKGGDTLFSNPTLAYHSLPPALKDRIANLQARHVWNYRNSGEDPPNPDDFTPETRHAIKPIVWKHPETGEPVLMVAKMFTDKIIGLSRTESDDLLRKLYNYMENPDLIYTHKWQVGDYLVWDNRALQHARTDFDPSELRDLRRVPIIESSMPSLN